MPFCASCGADVAGVRFCAKCGAPVESSAGPSPTATAGPAAGGAAGGAASDSGLSDNAAGALAYFTFIPAILFLLIDPFKTNRFVRFHAFQCLFLTAAAFAFWICFAIVTTAIGFVGGGVSLLVSMLALPLQLGIFIVWLLVVIKAFQGQEYKLPVIGDLAAKQV